MEIVRIAEDKQRFMDLLLLGDEQESMINKYLDRSEMFALYDGGLKGICVVTMEDADICEIKNIAVYSEHQRKGYGSRLLRYIIQLFKDNCSAFLVGTGDSGVTIPFYESLGFKYSHTVKDFFTDNYDHEIIENGVRLTDMVYYRLASDSIV